MTIRSALLRAFVWMLIGASLIMGALSFFQFRRALRTEIANNLQFGASAVMQRLDIFMAAQMEDLRVWRKMEVMQDLRVDDVDKRLSHFLSDLRAGQGSTYRALLCTGPHGRIIAASDPSLIGHPGPDGNGWKRLPGSQAPGVFIEPPGNRNGNVAMLRTAIPDAFGQGSIGTLYARVDWRAVQHLLDDAVAGGPRSLLLLDARGHVIAASRALRRRKGLDRLDLRRWRLPRHGATSYVHSGSALGFHELLVGAATSGGYQRFRGLGWHILMVEPTRVSFRPVWHLLWAMLALLLAMLAIGFWLSSRLAGRIARPMLDLTAFTRRFRQGEPTSPEVPQTGVAEVDELYRAYVDMIGALERSREQVVRAGKLAVVGELAAIMAHEVRTPMGIVRSSAQLLQRHAPLGERERELVGFILSETERLNRLVTMLLECARPKPPDFRPHDVHAIIDSVIGLIAPRAEKAGVHLERELDAADAVLECDREQIMQVVLNLVLNALEFVHAGGRVMVSTGRDNSGLGLVVADDGPGVPEDMRERIFDPFFSRREGGIGLGLTIVQQIVHVHGGEITVAESAWGGAAFIMHFPTGPNV